MTAVTYTAQRSLTVGHSQGTDYSIRIRCNARELSKDVEKDESRSLDGTGVETYLWRNQRVWSVTTAILSGGELDITLEFLESVIGGEQFTFDEFGLPGAPALPVNVKLEGIYRRVRALRQGDGGESDGFRFSFVVHEV